MRTSLLAAALLVGSLALPAAHHTLPFASVTVAAQGSQQDSTGQPSQSPPPAPQPATPSQPATAQAAPQQAQPAPQVNVDISSPSWHPSPTWIAIGTIGVVLLVVVVVMATKSESNTVIRG